jgi:hypothetical protein
LISSGSQLFCRWLSGKKQLAVLAFIIAFLDSDRGNNPWTLRARRYSKTLCRIIYLMSEKDAAAD